MKKQLHLITIISLLFLNVNAQTQLITNGNFSSSSGWTTSGKWHIGSPSSCYKSSSDFAFAGDSHGNPLANEYGNLIQTVTIPSTATSATLSFYTSQNTQETVAKYYDYIEVYLYNANGSKWLETLVDISNLNAATYPGCQSYKQYSFDVSAYIGQTIQLWFHVYSDVGPKNTLFRVDDVSLTYIGGCSTPSNPGNPTSNSPQAGSVTLTRAGSPPSGVIWYWQGTSCGTSTSLGTGTTFTATSSGTYFIRAYNNSGGCWSTNCGSVNVSVTAACTTPSTPGNPTSNSPQTGSVTLTRASSPPSGVTWYWQGTSCGTSTSLGSGTTFTATSSGTYYIRAYNNNGGCWSTNCGSVNVTISSFSSILGIDVHAEKGQINWSQVSATSNKTFAFVKATKGVCYIDSRFNTNMVNGKNAGVIMGAYHFALPEDNTAIAEADYFYNAAHSYIGPGNLPPALDIENPAGTCIVNAQPLTSYFKDLSILAKWVNDWATRIHTLTNIWPVLYGDRCNSAAPLYPYYQNGTINANIKLWIADYSHIAGSPGNYSGCNWVGWPWVFHQYSDVGVVAGISGQAVDLDIFNGDITAFNNLIEANPPNPPICNNDNPCSPTPISINASGICVNTSCSSVNATPPNPDISFYGGSSCATPYVPTRYEDDVWFSITPTTSSPITINLTPTSNISNFDVSVGLYQGSCSNPTQVGCATAGAKGDAENLSFTPIANTPYLIRVFSYDIGSTYSGNFDICVTTSLTSPNIDVAPASIIINHSGGSSINKPSYILFDNSENNPINNEKSDQVKITDHVMGCIIPDSIVEYWKSNKSSVKSSVIPSVALPAAIDWSSNDSPVKDQGVCGSCWAFAATAYIENLGSQSDLSEQAVLSCSGAGTCSLGYFDQALQFFKSTGVPAESCYPYTVTNGSCGNMCLTPDFKEKITTVNNTLWGFATVENLKTQLQEGPLVVRMLVPTDNTFDGNPGYKGGVYDYNGNAISFETRGHAVLLVGYDDSQKCFKVKNSWGAIWGENGYFRIAYDDVTDDVQFGSYAVNGSGVYTQNLSENFFTITNIGNGNLSITSITDNKNWLATSGYPATPFNIAKRGSQPLEVSIDWSLVGSSSQTGIITITSNDPDEPSVTVQVTANRLSTPSIIVSTNSLPDFGSVPANTNSSPQTYTVSGSKLTANIALTAPGGFQISTSSNSGFGSSLTLSQSGGTISNTTIYARFSPTSTGFQSGNISLTTTGATTKNVSVSGTGTSALTPTIAVSTTSLPDFGNLQVNTNSSPQTYTVSGSNLTGNITLTAPGGFQISTSSNSGFGNSLTLTQSGGTVSSTTIYARFSPTSTGFQSGSISHTSTGTTTKNVSNSGTATCAMPPAPSVGTITQPTCTLATGSVVLNGLPAIGTWTINPGGITGNGTSKTITNLSSGTYTYTVTNASGCTSNTSASFTISAQPPKPANPTANATLQPTCTVATGTITVTTPTGAGMTYSINGSAYTNATGIFTLVPAGTYTVTARNAAGCTSSGTSVIINPPPVTPAPPVLGIITQPAKTVTTGSVVLNGLPSTGTWTLTTNPGGTTTQGTGTSKTVSGLTAGTYSYTVTNASGCPSIPSANVVIYAQPAAPSVLTASSCNDLVTLKWSQNADPNFKRYRIYNGTTSNPTTQIDSTSGGISETLKIISGLTRGQMNYFRITAVNNGGAESNFSMELNATVKTGVIPEIKAKWGDLLICYNLDNLISKYQWFKGSTIIPNAIGQYYSAEKQAGTYFVETIDKDGCKNTSNTIQITSGTKSLTVYPNPVSVSFALRLTDTSELKSAAGESVTVSLINSTGQKVLELHARNANDELLKAIPVSQLVNGIYIVQVLLNNKELHYVKIVVLK